MAKDATEFNWGNNLTLEDLV